MSAHRQNYVPEWEHQRPAHPLLRPRVALIIAILGIGSMLLANFIASAHTQPAPRPEQHIPSLGTFDTEERVDTAARLAEIRAEAFAAGLAEGLGQGCMPQPLVLSSPIGAAK